MDVGFISHVASGVVGVLWRLAQFRNILLEAIMTEIETSLPIFQGGNERIVRPDDFVRLFADVFDTLLYKQLQLQSRPLTVDRTYTDNRTFWHDALRGLHFQGMRIFLQGFHLTEWMPSAPGRYFTPNAEASRKEAQHYIAYGRAERYLPLGKLRMVLGGVGSVRLGAKAIDSSIVYFLGASSTGISHQGIPVALPESEYRKAIQVIKERGGCSANLVGSLRALPTSMSIIHYDREIPRYCFFAEEVEVIRPSTEAELLTTVAIMFPSRYPTWDDKERDFTKDGYTTRFPKSWSFCSFRPGSAQRSLDAAVDWLRDYAFRYSGMYNPPILADFDEHYQYFDNPVEFSVSRLLRNYVDIERLEAYRDYYHLTINIGELIMGDVFKNITGSTIVSRSIVEKSFNKVRNDFDQDTAMALLRVAEEIIKSGNREVAELFVGFNEELQKPEPKKSVLRSLWDGMIAVLPSLAQLADVGLKISKLFT